MGNCCSSSRKCRPRGDEREPLLPKYTPEIPPQSQFDKAADILAALSTGKYPSQEQINRALGLLLSSDVLNTGNAALSGALSQRGQRMLEDARVILQALITLGMEKNGDDRLQDLLWQASRVEGAPIKINMSLDANISLDSEEGASKTPPQTISQEELTADVHRAASSIRPLISLLVTSSAFRLIISDILVTVRDILADVAVDVAKVAAIVEVRAEQVEEAVRPTDVELASGKDREGGVGVPALEDLAKVGHSIQENTAEATKMALEESEAKRRSIWERVENESPDRIKEKVLKRVNEIVEQAQASPQYMAALATIITLFQKYVKKLASTVEALGDAANATASSTGASAQIDPYIDMDPHLARALEGAKVIIGRFSGHGTDLLEGKVMVLLRDFRSQNDHDFPALISSTTDWIKRALQQPGWIQMAAAQEEGSGLYDRLFELLHRDPRLKADARGVLEETYILRDALANDRTTNTLLTAVNTLLSDLGTMGRVGVRVATTESAKQWEVAKVELFRDIMAWVLPRVLRAVRTIPLPRVELKSDALDLVVDKVTLVAPSLVPDHIQVTNHTDILLRASDATTDTYFDTSTSTHTRVVIQGLRISVEDIAYYLNAKGPFWTGWLDNGLLTIDVGGKRVEGDGISLVLDIEVPSQERRIGGHDLFRVLDVKVDVPGLAFSLNQTRHWIFNTLVTQPLLGPLVRTGISLVLSAQIKAALATLNARLCSLRDKAQVIHGVNSSPLTIEDYWTAFTRSQETGLPTPSPEPLERGSSSSLDQGPHTHVETEVTTKGIIRVTVTENAEGVTQSETVLAIGIASKFTRDWGGPGVEAPLTLVEQGREALDDLDQIRKDARGQVAAAKDEVLGANEVVRNRLSAAGTRMLQRRSRFAKNPGWRSSAFDL